MCACVRVCVRACACVRACVRVCVCVCVVMVGGGGGGGGGGCAFMRERVCVFVGGEGSRAGWKLVPNVFLYVYN